MRSSKFNSDRPSSSTDPCELTAVFYAMNVTLNIPEYRLGFLNSHPVHSGRSIL